MVNKPLAHLVAVGLLSAPLAYAQTPPQNAPQAGTMGDQQGGIDPRRDRLQLGGPTPVRAGNHFNPAISVILDAVYGNFSTHIDDPAGFGGGHDHAHGHGHGLEEGFQLREAEIAISGPVDPYFDMMVQLGVTAHDIEIEEAYITTRALPAGFQIKAGKFLSDVGYINRQHIHEWDFVDQPWMREFIFGDEGLNETGIQLSWLAPTRHYTRIGVEVLEGTTPGVANYMGHGEEGAIHLHDETGPRLFTAFAAYAPNIGYEHAVQFGVSAGHATSFQDQEVHSSGRVETWEGDAWFAGLDVVYKYNGRGVMGHGNVTVQGEYFIREQDLTYGQHHPTDGDTVGAIRPRQDGLYVQGVYGFAPRWNTGLRLDVLGLTNEAFDGLGPKDASTSFRYTGQVSYSPTEFSRIRAQIAYNDLHEPAGEHGHGAWQFLLQYNISLGEHGAHTF